MRLLICTGIFPPETGGPATYSERLAIALKKRGHQVSLITYTNKGEQNIRDYDFPVIRIRRSRFKPFHYFKYFKAVIRYGKDVDLLYAQDPVSAGYPTYLASKVIKKKYVVKVTGDYSWEQAMGRGLTDAMIDDFQKLSVFPGPIGKIRDMQIRTCKYAAKVITPSVYLKNLVVGWGVKDHRISVVYNSASLPKFENTKQEARQKLGIADDEYLVISSGRNVPWKGFVLLEEVLKDLQNQKLDLRYKFFHSLPRKELLEYYRAADLYVLNTGYEGLSHTLLEVMAAGTPIITTNVGGNPEVITDGETGVLVEYNNRQQIRTAILRMHDEKELAQKFVKNSAKIPEKFTIDSMINQTEQVLNSLIHST